MNAFFASCEQHANPSLRGRPIVVAPLGDTDRTCCIAASYEAKEFGIKTGTSVRDARRLCPHVEIVEANPREYVRLHHEIVNAVESCIHVTGVHSIDEMSARLMGRECEKTNSSEIAHRIKKVIRQRVSPTMRCSIGIAPNRLLAKIAADMMKPNGLTVIDDNALPHILHPLKLQDIPGISSAMERRLNKFGIKTIEELCAASSNQLYDAWHSVLGRQMHLLLRGEDVPDVPTKRRSVGHSHVLAPDFRNEAGARSVCIKLIARAAERLRRINYWAGRLELSVEHYGGEHWINAAPLGLCQDTQTMLEMFAMIWTQRPKLTPFHVGITLLGLQSDASVGSPLYPTQARRARLATTVDFINRKLGSHAVYFGSMHGMDKAAPTRISFTQIPDADLDF